MEKIIPILQIGESCIFFYQHLQLLIWRFFPKNS